MPSLCEALARRLDRDPRPMPMGVARFDLALLLLDARDSLFALWRAADACARSPGTAAQEELRAALERLRPIFGARGG